jgi:hypothetical protein
LGLGEIGFEPDGGLETGAGFIDLAVGPETDGGVEVVAGIFRIEANGLEKMIAGGGPLLLEEMLLGDKGVTLGLCSWGERRLRW